MDPLWLFALFVFGIIVIPGVDMAYVLASTLVDGRRAGLAAVAGMVAGGAVHMLMGALGVGLLLQLVPGAFRALLTAGAMYVGWMGVMLWRHPATLSQVELRAPRAPARTFARAMTTCLLNPKAYLFMVAVFPQFIRPDQGSVVAQAAGMGAILALVQALVYGAVALGAASVRDRLAASQRRQMTLARAVAVLLVATAAWALWTGWSAG